ncbi:MAG: tRNA preQ1(34) S-adenosylmethionine ribosyltransferase-isomerase QueA [Planctomycetota bacterium]|nr:tRNA preQ1(34) S-adenosylmethionine ribosyltransferase-isomerase QueA [Planctomycetota bacterium]
MKISDFDFDLPPGQIAQSPARPRDSSRLMRLDRATGAVTHHRFSDLPDLLRPDDLLVVNDTRVIPAAFTARRASGARIEGIFLRVLPDGLWEVLLQGRGRLREGQAVALVDAAGQEQASLALVGRGEGGSWYVRPPEGTDAVHLLEKVGRPPLPPYIRRKGEAAALAASDREDYQTVYACRNGAVAAPTAGLHFTPRVLERLAARGVERVAVTLHVGVGTFQPVRVERLADHRMHEEFADISPEAAAAINRARAGGRRIVAVGTTTVRALESAAGEGGVQAGGRWTGIFIRPPHEFRAVDALVTNFHLPRSTLLVLVSAFAGRDRILAAYAEAVREGYRFFSYGDAMLIV